MNTDYQTRDGSGCFPACVQYVSAEGMLNGNLPNKGVSTSIIEQILEMDAVPRPITGSFNVPSGVSAYIKKDQFLYISLQKWVKQGVVHSCTAQNAFNLWKSLLSLSTNKLLVPGAAEGNNGEILLMWSRNEHYLEIEILPDSLCAIFYKNEKTLADYFFEGNYDEFPYAEMPEILKFFIAF